MTMSSDGWNIYLHSLLLPVAIHLSVLSQSMFSGLYANIYIQSIQIDFDGCKPGQTARQRASECEPR